jgi:hypothetical protein
LVTLCWPVISKTESNSFSCQRIQTLTAPRKWPHLFDMNRKVVSIVNPIIAKILTVGAAFSRDSRLEGAPTKRCQKLTSGEFQKQHKNSHCIL